MEKTDYEVLKEMLTRAYGEDRLYFEEYEHFSNTIEIRRDPPIYFEFKEDGSLDYVWHENAYTY